MVSTHKKSSKTKKLPKAPLAWKAAKTSSRHPLFEKTSRNHRIGGDIQPRRDLSRYVKWPRYVLLQRQKKVLLQRLKVPPALNQFSQTIDKNQTSTIMRLLAKYKPENKAQKRQRLVEEAQKIAKGTESNTKKPIMLKSGLNHVTQMIENKKAKLVVIAHDVDPIELVCWLPALCRKKDVPYCIIKSKARLGKLTNMKTATVVAVDHIRKEDQSEFDTFCKNVKSQFNDNIEVRRQWGGGLVGIKSTHTQEMKDKTLAIEAAKKLGIH